MKFYYIYSSVFVLFILLSCDAESVDTRQSIDSDGVIQSVITHSAGDSWNASDEFLPLPMNIGKVNDKDVFVLSDREKVGSKIGIIPLGSVKLLENDSIKTYVLAIPSDIKRKHIDADDFDEFSTIYSSAKWIIEQYLVNRKGSNQIKVKSWENEKSAINYLLN